jgi:hypothetical protein
MSQSRLIHHPQPRCVTGSRGEFGCFRVQRGFLALGQLGAVSGNLS